MKHFNRHDINSYSQYFRLIISPYLAGDGRHGGELSWDEEIDIILISQEPGSQEPPPTISDGSLKWEYSEPQSLD